MSEIKLDMRLKQALRISPQLLQSTQILQMNAQNLREYVDKALEENPVLDKAPEYEAQREFQELCRQAGWISGQGVRTGSSSGEDPYRPDFTVGVSFRPIGPKSAEQAAARAVPVSGASTG